MYHQPPVRLTYRLLSYLMSGLLVVQPVLPAFGATLTPTGNTATDSAANGVPVVNIATPNSAGISHNQFTDYNVGKEGLILNNATDKLNPTQLGGIITSNPNLTAGKEAKGIINEVIGGNRSQLQGYTEVAGKAANVMVANPYGITCNGCGFINTPQATLTTGKPVLDANGNLQMLDVKQGSITIAGQGMDASGSDALAIISRATEVNAAIHAQDLTVIAGANRVDAEGHIQAQPGEGNAPSVAVDTGALGGMYANRIHLVSNDKGVGVNLGNLHARQGDITLDSNGKLTMHNSLASGAIAVRGQSIALSGDHKASGNITLDSQSDIALSNGSLNSDGDLLLNATETLAQRTSKLTAGRDITLGAKNISEDGASQINAARDITTKATHTLSNQGQITAGHNLTASAATLTQDGKLLANGNTELQANTLKNSGSVQGGALTMNSTTLHNSGSLLSGGNLIINTQDFTQSGSLGAKGTADITANGQMNNTGLLVSEDSLTLTAGDAMQNGTLSGGKGLTINAETLSSDKNAVTHTDGNLTLTATTLTQQGEVSASGDMQLQSDILNTTASAQLQSGKNLTIKAREATLAGTQAAQQSLTIDASEKLTHSGKSSAAALALTAPQINNSGVLVADTLNTQSQTLSNSGLLQGDNSLTVNTSALHNQLNGTLYSGENLTLDIPQIKNSGLITSDKSVKLNTTTLTNPGKITASALTVKTATLTSDGLLQGANALAITGDNLSQGTAGRWLTAGDLSLSGQILTTAGTTQGQNLNVNAKTWDNGGSALATGNLNSTLTEALRNNGDLMSKGNFTLTAPTLNNHGNLLSSGDLALSGNTFSNHGVLQGNNLHLTGQSIINQGSITGQNALTLNSTGALNNSGDLLSQKALMVTAGDVTNSGRLQGQNIILDGTSLTNSGAIQSAQDLALTLNDNVITAPGSKITAMGSARISGKTVNNQGLVSANTLKVKGDSLTNSGEISGVTGLNLALNGQLDQQGKILTGGVLNVKAQDINNNGQLQGADTQISASSLTNDGRVQGDSNLTLILLHALTNKNSGVLLSQNGLSLTAPELTNDGTIQGNGITTLNATTQTRNSGKILSGGDLTFTTPDYSGSGWLQATNLMLNMAKLVSNGTVMAANQATLTSNDLINSGTLQAAQLDVNTQTASNSGTLLGNKSLTLRGNSLNNTGGNIFSGGDMLAEIASLSGTGQLVALGNLTLKLTNSLAAQGIIAANKQLSISSRGDITNTSTLQGEGITLNAAGKLINNGQLTAGRATTALSGSEIALNASGSLQAGGDVSLTSLSNITLAGFTGSAGNLLLNATDTIINTALLYAGNNLSLFANRIHNLRGDMLAGNNLLMQKDASGTANTEVINTSGNIETTNGDITMNTAHLLNTRDGLETKTTQISGTQAIPGMGKATIKVDISQLAEGSYGMTSHTRQKKSGPCNAEGACDYITWNQFYYAMYAGSAEQKFINSQVRTDVISKGGASRIAAGKNLTIHAQALDNFASNILANGDISLSGQAFNNQSWQAGTVTDWLVYQYDPRLYGYAVEPGGRYPTDGNGDRDVMPKSRTIAFTLKGHDSTTEQGEVYRSVIQAGGQVAANFSNDISNTNSTANAGKITNTIIAPALNTPSAQSIGGGVSEQALTDGGTQAINAPDWQDTTTGLTIGSNIGLLPAGIDGNYPLPSGDNGYFVPSTNPDSPYLITVNPKLDGLGQLDPSLFGDLYKLLGMAPGATPKETNPQYTNADQFLGSSYLLNRLNLNPDKDYRFLGDEVFDTRYVSNYVLNQTGARYINGLGSDLDQMRYLMDNAADAQHALGLQFGVALTAGQVAALNNSIVWWERATINGQSVMVPKVYLSAKDVTVHSGSVISGNNVQLAGGNITNSGSTLLAQNSLALDSSNTLSNLNAGLISAGGGLNLSALGDINNTDSRISGKTVQLESTGGSINNVTRTAQWRVDSDTRRGNVHLSGTDAGQIASISASDSLTMGATNDINITGAKVAAGDKLVMAAGDNINIAANQMNHSSSRSGFWEEKNSSSTLTSNQGSSITAGSHAEIQAGNNLNVTAGAINAGKTAQLKAGNDLNLAAAGNGQSSSSGSWESHQSSADRTTLSAGDKMTLLAGRDITSQGAGIAAEGDIGIQAGRDVSLAAIATGSGSSTRESRKTVIDESVRQQGSEIASGGNTTITAGRDINSAAAQVTAEGDIGVTAGRDINLTTATESDYHYKEQTKSKKKLFSKKTTHTIEEDSATREAGTLLSGKNVTVRADNNLQVKGSSVVGDNRVALGAGNNVDIVAATHTDTHWRFKEEKKSGLMSSGGIGLTLGSNKTTHDLREAGTTQSQSFSTVGSTGGSVEISAGNQVHTGGADLIAGKDLSLSGSSVITEPGHDRRSRDETFEQKKSGLTVALSGTAGSAINNAISTAQETKEQSDGRLKTLQATKTALSGVQAGQAVNMETATADPNALGVSLSLTTQKSKSQQHAESDEVAGSTLTAGNRLSVTANGKTPGQGSGDIVIAGSQLKAGGDIALDAQHGILLTGVANTQKSSGSNSSSGGGVGVSIGGGGNGAGLSIFANVNAAHGRDRGNGTEWTETTLDSGKTVTLKSGHDTVLEGAQVSGDKIRADVGHDLLMQSQRDNNDYDSKQNSVAAGGSFTFGSMSGSGYISASQDKMKSRFDSVAQQTGLYAGKEGFDITVGSHTQLDGAVVTSAATADKNRLDTGTLGFSDLHNEADFKTSHSGISLSGGGSLGDKFQGNMPGGMITAAGSKGHKEGTTQAAVAEGSLVIRESENQKQDVAELSRDTVHASDSISPIFNKEKEQNRLKVVGMLSDIGSQAADIARTQGELNGLKAAQEVTGEMLPANATEAQRQNYLARLRDTQVYKDEVAKYGTGSDMQRGIQAVTAALQGLAGGNIGGALAGASAPELANIIGHHAGIENNPAARGIAHALLGGVTAALQGNSAAAGAAGAATGELVATAIAGQLYPGTGPGKLTEEQKQTVSTLATIAAGMAGGIAGGNTAGAAAGASGGKNAVENNALGDIAQAQSESKTLEQKAREYVEAENERYKKAHCSGMSAEACSVKMYNERREQLKNTVSLGADFVPVVGDIKSFAEAQSALDYLAAAIGIIPGAGDAAGKAIKAAEIALKKGDVAEASKLINKASDGVSATLPMGSKRNPMNQPSNPSYQPVRNKPGIISNREYSGHALDRMQDRGITPSVVENTIKNGKSAPSRGGTTVYFDPESKVSVVTNKSGRVVTVKYGDK